MDWPTGEDCHEAMTKLAEYYFQGEQLDFWRNKINEDRIEGRFPSGKGFLYDIDQAIRVSYKPPMPERSDLYQLICAVCI